MPFTPRFGTPKTHARPPVRPRWPGMKGAHHYHLPSLGLGRRPISFAARDDVRARDRSHASVARCSSDRKERWGRLRWGPWPAPWARPTSRADHVASSAAAASAAESPPRERKPADPAEIGSATSSSSTRLPKHEHPLNRRAGAGPPHNVGRQRQTTPPRGSSSGASEQTSAPPRAGLQTRPTASEDVSRQKHLEMR